MAPDTTAMRDITRAFREKMIATRSLASDTIARSWRVALSSVDFGDSKALQIALSQWFQLAYQQSLGINTMAATDAMAFVRAYAEAAAPSLGTIELRDLSPSEFATYTGTTRTLKQELAGPIIEMHTALAKGMRPARAFVLGEARARRTASTTIVRASDQAANRLAKQSKRFRGWRRVLSANPCGACLAAAGRSVEPMSATLSWHPGCRCSRAFVPVGESDAVLDWVPSGEDVFGRMTPEQQANLFAGRGGDAKAALVRDGKVPFDALLSEDGNGRTSEASLSDMQRIAAAREKRGIASRPIGSSGGSGQGGGGTPPTAPSGEPGPLPHRDSAHVDDAKLSYYLDEARRMDSSSKVGLFRDVLGFTDSAALRSALIAHAQAHDAVIFRETDRGTIWNVDGPMVGPSGRTVDIRSGWMIHHGSTMPINTTAFRRSRPKA